YNEGRGPDPQRYEVQMASTDVKAGAARSEVHAPMDVVVKTVTDYAKYAEHISRFEKAKVVGKHGDTTDVYLQVTIAKGLGKVWGVMRMEPPRNEGNDIVVAGKLLKGNVKRLDVKYRIKKVDDQNTHLDM